MNDPLFQLELDGESLTIEDVVYVAQAAAGERARSH